MSDEAVAPVVMDEAPVETPKPASEEEVRTAAFEEMPPEQLAQIEAIKAQGVKLHAIPIFQSVFGDDKVWYAYRTIKRREWHKLQFEHRQRMQTVQEELTQAEVESMFEDAVVAMCSVSPKVEYENVGSFDAGAISTLADAIMFSSGFNQNAIPVQL